MKLTEEEIYPILDQDAVLGNLICDFVKCRFQNFESYPTKIEFRKENKFVLRTYISRFVIF